MSITLLRNVIDYVNIHKVYSCDVG